MLITMETAGGSGGGGGSIKPSTEIPNSAITTAGGYWTATEDCVMCGIVTGGSEFYAQIFIDDDDNNNNALISVPNGVSVRIGMDISANPINCGVFIPKGKKVIARNSTGCTYNIHFYKPA